MALGVCRESAPGDRRVALVPRAVREVQAMGLDVLVECGAGEGAGLPDRAYRAAGAKVVTRSEVLSKAAVVAGIRVPVGCAFRRGQAVVALVDPMSALFQVRRWADEGLTVIGLDLVPEDPAAARAFDAVASLDRLAGYKAALLAADLLDRPVPAGRTPGFCSAAARVLVIGRGTAALQAAQTLRDLGAEVFTGDSRPGGGAPGPETMDVVIATAGSGYRGRPPTLVTARSLAGMRPGSVVVDLSAGPDGGTVAGVRAGAVSTAGRGVVVAGAGRLAEQLPRAASEAFSHHVVALLHHAVSDGELWIDPADPALAAVLLTHGGLVRQPDVWRSILTETAAAGLP
ncbi:NAD(P) transhydrogenase subunit alpha [Streptomyces sp. NPDC056224]|uniref:NAD(P) transhydrogenase subunit alpha n=1 Tax=Streptomyces sp. NPDC056224 TaxID=3345750 RepID=UPI0035DDBA3A